MKSTIPAHRVWKMNTRAELFEYVTNEILQLHGEFQGLCLLPIRKILILMLRVRFILVSTRELKLICLTMARVKRDTPEMWVDLMSKREKE